MPSAIRKIAAKIAEDRHASRALANPDRSQPENFLARVKRVSNRDADWLRAHHGLLEQAMADHMDGILGDAHLMDSLERAAHGMPADRQPLPAVARAAE